MKLCSEVKEIMAEDYIFTENMTVGYGRIPLIEQIELHVRRGEIVTLIGPNGAGKSTILRSIIRQLGLLGGNVYLDGQSMEGMTEKQIARRMSVLMTERIRPELMTCKDVVGTGRYPYTGRLGILTAAGHEKGREGMETSGPGNWQTGILWRSAMDKNRGSFWRAPSARSPRQLFWMNQPPF